MSDSPTPPVPTPPPLPVPPEPFSARDLRRAAARPSLLVECLLGRNDRLGSTLSGGNATWTLAVLLTAVSLLSPIPYGLLAPTASAWKVAVLFAGSLGICFPCLYMFGQYLGLDLGLARSLALALIVTAVAGLFTLAFAPIIWFITFTVQVDPGSTISPRGLSVFLLAVCLLLGVVQMYRCLLGPHTLSRQFPNGPLLVTTWLALLAFITFRMARLLDVL